MRYAALVLVLLAGGLVVAHRKAYGSFPWDGGPDRVQWCDRRYYRSSEDEPRAARLKPVFRAPPLVGDRFYADQANCAGPAQLVLYRDVSDGEVEAYPLSGGP